MSLRCEPAAMIEVNGLTKRLGGRVVVDDVSFRCEPRTVGGGDQAWFEQTTAAAK
jgi:hypothetical protein